MAARTGRVAVELRSDMRGPPSQVSVYKAGCGVVSTTSGRLVAMQTGYLRCAAGQGQQRPARLASPLFCSQNAVIGMAGVANWHGLPTASGNGNQRILAG